MMDNKYNFNSTENEFVKKITSLPKNVRPEIVSALDQVMNKYDKTLRNLRDR